MATGAVGVHGLCGGRARLHRRSRRCTCVPGSGRMLRGVYPAGCWRRGRDTGLDDCLKTARTASIGSSGLSLVFRWPWAGFLVLRNKLQNVGKLEERPTASTIP